MSILCKEKWPKNRKQTKSMQLQFLNSCSAMENLKKIFFQWALILFVWRNTHSCQQSHTIPLIDRCGTALSFNMQLLFVYEPQAPTTHILTVTDTKAITWTRNEAKRCAFSLDFILQEEFCLELQNALVEIAVRQVESETDKSVREAELEREKRGSE